MLRTRDVFLLSVLNASAASPVAAAARFDIIHDFTGGKDGGGPGYTLASDGAGHFFGAANSGGTGAGVVFELTKRKSVWRVKPIYDFSDQDGQPGWGVTLSGGAMYTVAHYASVQGGPCGSALQLASKSGVAKVKDTATLMHTYVKSEDGCPTGNLTVDPSGNVFGVTQDGGANGWGSIVEFVPSKTGWTEQVLYSFTGGSDGGAPYSELVRDSAGNFYGTASACASDCVGTAFELSPSESGWTYHVLHSFTGGNDSGQPVAAMVFDAGGNLYGATSGWGSNSGGTVFELSPSGGAWTFSTLARMSGSDGPVAALTLDATGHIYGTNFMDGTGGYGSVFSLSKTAKGWKYRTLHDFAGGADGGYPGGGVTLDAKGNLYGTAVIGGANNHGVIYRIKP